MDKFMMYIFNLAFCDIPKRGNSNAHILFKLRFSDLKTAEPHAIANLSRCIFSLSYVHSASQGSCMNNDHGDQYPPGAYSPGTAPTSRPGPPAETGLGPHRPSPTRKENQTKKEAGVGR